MDVIAQRLMFLLSSSSFGHQRLTAAFQLDLITDHPSRKATLSGGKVASDSVYSLGPAGFNVLTGQSNLCYGLLVSTRLTDHDGRLFRRSIQTGFSVFFHVKFFLTSFIVHIISINHIYSCNIFVCCLYRKCDLSVSIQPRCAGADVRIYPINNSIKWEQSKD